MKEQSLKEVIALLSLQIWQTIMITIGSANIRYKK